ncbi:protein smg8 [Phtheirospermum japonicum]|uniref:Nonsense-mediated mRNA decay factor SMG8 n=1 Tax=Phtheirospermum japonicum TaxID=374723 RepID=A0A830D0C6_9LAMI|nr:protein smg8 [Phtheirospermum japonicum]
METHSQSIRVLIRPPPAPTSAPALPPQLPPPPPDPYLPPKNGVVVVGFIGKRYHDVSHLINKVVDSHVFGSGNLDTQFRFEPDKINPEMSNWFESKKLSFYHDEDQGILYLQFSSLSCPVTEEGFSDSRVGSEPIFEDQELGDLQGLIFMFSVCHLIILIQEGSRFDTQMLKKFRVLQAAKNTMAPFVKSQNAPPATSRAPRSAVNSRVPISGPSPKNPSPSKTRGIINRNASATTLMSGLGSYTSFLPGQCTPVVLFVFLDEFTETQTSANIEETAKGSGQVVVLARPANKLESGLRKKLQSSLEAQIRFSIKKCRTLSGSENGPRSSGPVTGSAPPLFSLDASRAVLLVDSRSCQGGESLEFAIGLVEDVLDGKATPDSFLLENDQQKNDDVAPVKDFIHRQCDLLRGKGGLVSGGSAGVGMFAAAVSAASKKMLAAPDLPNFEIWSSSSRPILYGILSADPFESAVSNLENGIGINAKFSTSWCEKVFPIAKGVYLDNLPHCYPSSRHDEHLSKALRALTSMVKGPAVRAYTKKLKDECTSIWTSGRQLCDAVSLTGKPCVHQRHDSTDEIESHSSGFVYLHACACGRSRRPRPDPFDYETANVACGAFADCDKLLPAVKLPEGNVAGPVRPSSWNLIRVGSAKYYDPSKGLLQSGFCPARKFLLKWTLYPEKPNEAIVAETVNVGIKTGLPSNINGNISNVSVGRGSNNFTMRKPFSEVVAGLAAASSAFPPLSTRKQQTIMPDTEKGVKLHFQMVEKISSVEKEMDNGDHFPRIGSNLVSLNRNSSGQVKIFVGFEHECPHGHRFILTQDHLSELGSAYSVADDNTVPLLVENSDKKQDFAKLGKNGGHGRGRRNSREKMANGNVSINKSTKLIRQGKDQNEKTKVSDFVRDFDSDDRKQTSVDDAGCGFSLVSRNLPIYMNCPHCRDSTTKIDASDVKFASTVSQLQRIFVVTPSFPVLLAANPIIQFEFSCLPPSIPDRERKLQFSLGCPVTLPPDSFLSLRLPFIYGVQFDDGSVHSLKPFENQPQMTARIVKGTTLRVVSNRSNLDPASVT